MEVPIYKKKTFTEKLNEDQEKIKIAETEGYIIHIIWNTDSVTEHIKIANIIKNKINDRN